MRQTLRYLYAFFAFTLICPITRAIVPSTSSNNTNLQNLVYAPKAQFHKSIGRVCYSSDIKNATTPGAIVGSRRFITFTESLPSKIKFFEITEGDQTAKQKVMYKVIKTLEIHSYTHGFFVCLEVDRDFQDASPLKFPTANNDEFFAKVGHPSLAYLVGYGSNGSNFDVLRACVTTITTLKEEMSVFSCDYRHLHNSLQTYSGMLGSDDQGAFVMKNIDNQWYIIGYAEITPAIKDFSRASFIGDGHYFRRILKFPEDLKNCLYQINDIQLTKDGIKFDEIKTQIRANLNTKATTSVKVDTTAQTILDMITIPNIQKILHMQKNGTANQTVLIDTQILLTKLKDIANFIIQIDGEKYQPDRVKAVDNNYFLVKLNRPVLNASPLMRARNYELTLQNKYLGYYLNDLNLDCGKLTDQKINIFVKFADESDVLNPKVNEFIDYVILRDALLGNAKK